MNIWAVMLFVAYGVASVSLMAGVYMLLPASKKAVLMDKIEKGEFLG